MNGLNSIQLEIQKLARQFVQREMRVSPSSSAKLLLEKLGALGLINVRIPEKYGGSGLKTIDACIITEELASADSGLGASILASELACSILLCSIETPQKENLLLSLAKTSSLAALSLDTQQVHTIATLQAVQLQDEFVLNGRCLVVMNAHLADWLIVIARLSGEVENTKISADGWISILVPLSSTENQPDITIIDSTSVLGRDAKYFASVNLNNVKVAKSNLLIFSGSIKSMWQKISFQAFPIIASACIGLAKSSLNHAIAYSKERLAFGQPIANHQAISFMLADIAKDIEAARQMTWQAALSADCGYEDIILANSCKAFAQEISLKATTEAVQILGAYGYCREYQTEKLMRDAAQLQILCGDNHQLKSTIGKSLSI
jgi:alkylation response protein AidB-like acyl-CoA dehydrogenase